MSIAPESLQVGQCYLTHTGFVQRVIAFPQGRVQYETRVNRGTSGWSWRPGIVDPKVFAALLERLVPCDWTLERDDVE